jgi:hypothetical protein
MTAPYRPSAAVVPPEPEHGETEYTTAAAPYLCRGCGLRIRTLEADGYCQTCNDVPLPPLDEAARARAAADWAELEATALELGHMEYAEICRAQVIRWGAK